MVAVGAEGAAYVRSMNNFRSLRVGDNVIRLMGEAVPMRMRVLKVDGGLIYATHDKVSRAKAIRDDLIWTFDAETGAEVDPGLGWGPAYGITGTRLVDGHPV